MEEEFSHEDIHDSIKEAKEGSASGISGQSITIFKYLLNELPLLINIAINQIAFRPDLMSHPKLQCIKQRKIIYINKKPQPKKPEDYRPLSMLEVLYKIPSRILGKRLNNILPKIIGEHQHGFMKGKGIQEPLITATHVIQDSKKNNKSLQLLALDISKAFDTINHNVILQALAIFKIPEIIIQAIANLSLQGKAIVEVNGIQGNPVEIRTGSGQGDPISSPLFNIGSEPLNRALVQLFSHIHYKINNKTIPPQIFADDNLTAYQLQNIQNFYEVKKIYTEYSTVSGLHINLTKSHALCINTNQQLEEELRQTGLEMPSTIPYLGIQLGHSIEQAVKATLEKTNPKSIKRRIMATTPPTDILHRATLINTALTPIYNHISMALPLNEEQMKTLYEDILSFLWTRQKDGVAINKRRMVAKNRISASYSMGGLQIPHPNITVAGLQQNIIQKAYRKEIENNKTTINDIIYLILHATGRHNLVDHVHKLGPLQWELTAKKIATHNQLISKAFEAISTLQIEQEQDRDSWGMAPIYGHTATSKLYPLNLVDATTLWHNNCLVVSQMFEQAENGTLLPQINQTLQQQITNYPLLTYKIKKMIEALKKMNLKDTTTSNQTILKFQLASTTKNISPINKRINRIKTDKQIKTPPAYNTRMLERIDSPEINTFKEAYLAIKNPLLSSKTKENSFSTLNRTLWTNNKAYKSGINNTPNCKYCEQVETMEHMLYGCPNYSNLQWETWGKTITTYIKEYENPEATNIYLNYQQIIFNKTHPLLTYYMKDNNKINTLNLIVHEIRRDIYYRKVNLTINEAVEVLTNRRIAHLITTITKSQKYLEYLSHPKWTTSIEMIKAMINILQRDIT